jgi:hypothetical protein
MKRQLVPSQVLWAIALGPLLVFGGAACGRSSSGNPDGQVGAGGQAVGGAAGGVAAGGSGLQAGTGGVESAGGAAGGKGGTGGRGGGGGTGAVRVCAVAGATAAGKTCRTADECAPPGPNKCCTGEPCWPDSACPFPPSMCPSQSSRFQCVTTSDCAPGGTCVSVVSGCPQCESRSCKYPPPPCTQTPDSCGPEARCQPDGTCGPLSCADGYACAAGARCRPGSARADAHQCELIPCDDGWTCEQNTRCKAPTTAGSHGCTALACTKDEACDCGYCVNGACAASLGWCSYPPQ